MATPLTYRDIYEQRVAAGLTGDKKPQPKGDNNSMRIEGVNDPTDSKFPIVPPPPASGLPVDDKYKAYRTDKA
jgi:hypothetical protein